MNKPDIFENYRSNCIDIAYFHYYQTADADVEAAFFLFNEFLSLVFKNFKFFAKCDNYFLSYLARNKMEVTRKKLDFSVFDPPPASFPHGEVGEGKGVIFFIRLILISSFQKYQLFDL